MKWFVVSQKCQQKTLREESNLLTYTVRTKSTVNLEVNGKPLAMEVDTGAAVSIISRRVQQKLFPDTVIRPSRVLLRTYTGELMATVGEMTVEVRYGDQVRSLVLIVVQGDGPSLFGRNWLGHITLNFTVYC